MAPPYDGGAASVTPPAGMLLAHLNSVSIPSLRPAQCLPPSRTTCLHFIFLHRNFLSQTE
jgi:hypothetical protein